MSEIDQHSHGPACPPGTHCHIHNVDEPARPGDYRVCGECWHVFRTVGELVAEYNDLHGEMGYDQNGTVVDGHPEPAIYACPLCTHDF